MCNFDKDYKPNFIALKKERGGIMKIFRYCLILFFLSFVLIIVQGCGLDSDDTNTTSDTNTYVGPTPTQGDIEIGQIASISMQLMDLASMSSMKKTSTSATENIANQKNRTAREGLRGFTGSWDIDRTIDLDEKDTNDQDLYPNASGSIRIQGSSTLSTDYGSYSIDPLTTTFVTDVTLTDSESGATATIAKDASMMLSTQGSYSFNILTHTLTLTNDFSSNTQDLDLTITYPGKDSVSVNIDTDIDATIVYTDSSLSDNEPGTMKYDIYNDSSISWSEGEVYNEVTMTTEIDNTVNPNIEKITLIINDTTYGPYTCAQFVEVFSVMLNYYEELNAQ